MLRQYASQLLLEVKPSRAFLVLVIILLALSFLSILGLQINSIAVKVLLMSFICMYALYSLLNNTHRTILWQADGSWLLSVHGKNHKATLGTGNVVTTLFVSLNFVFADGKKHTLFLFRDSLDTEQFRRLRVKLKVQANKVDSHDTRG